MAAVHQSYLDDLCGLVYDEKRIVTYKWLAVNSAVSATAAKCMLYEFAKNQGDKVITTYLVSGRYTLHGNPTIGVVLVPADRLDAAKSSFDEILSIHVFSVAPADLKYSVPSAATALWAVDHEQVAQLGGDSTAAEVLKTHSLAAVCCDAVELKSYKRPVVVMETDAPAPHATVAPRSTSKDSGPTVSMKGVAINNFFENGPKAGGAAGKKGAKAAPPDKKDAKKKIGGFFGSAPSEAKAAAKPVSSDGAKDKAPQKEVPKANAKSVPPPEPEAEPVAEPAESSTTSEAVDVAPAAATGEDDEEAEWVDSGATATKPAQKKAVSTPQKEKSAAKPKRKKVVESDSDEGEGEDDDFVKKKPKKAASPKSVQSPKPKAKPQPRKNRYDEVVADDSDEDAGDTAVSATKGGRKRKQDEQAGAIEKFAEEGEGDARRTKRVQREETYVDEKGYMVTKMVWVDVEVDESQAPAPPVKPQSVVAAAAKKAPAPSSKAPAKSTGGGKGKKGAAANGVKQKDMFSFFKKG